MNDLLIRTVAVFMRSNTRRLDVWEMAGPAGSDKRRQLMTILAGEKLPKSQCGINALRERLYQLSGVKVDGICQAAMQDAFVEWCNHILEADNAGQ